jgi:glycine/D-amino acid oxidase-like deaminating enzyme
MTKCSVDVAVIGGGIIGLACAYFLHRRGLKVAIADKGSLSTEQSRRNSGFIRQQGRDVRELDLIRRSLELWSQIPSEIGADVGFARQGNLAVTMDPAKVAAMENWTRVAAEHGIRSRVVGHDEIKALVPRLVTKYLGGLYTASDCQGEPFQAGAALARFLSQSGVLVLDHAHVRELLVENGRVGGIRTERDEIKAEHVIVAAGLWSSLFLGRYGIDLPVADLRITVGRTAPFEHGLSVPTWTPRTLVRPRQDGGLTIALGQDGPADFDLTADHLRNSLRFLPNYLANRSGVKVNFCGRHREQRRFKQAYAGRSPGGMAEIRTQPVAPNTQSIATCVEAAREEFSFANPLSLVESWACRADMTPDGIPIIGPAPSLPGLTIVTGMNGHGFGISMGIGEAVADMLTASQNSSRLAAFSLARFSENYFHKPMNVL